MRTTEHHLDNELKMNCMAQLMPLPLTISCSSKSDRFYLSGAGSPG